MELESIIIDNVPVAHVSEVIRVEKEAWPEELRAPEDKFRQRLEKFPHGFFGIYVNGVLAGTLTSMRTNKTPQEDLKWDEVTGNGYVSTHEANGAWLYVVSLGVSEKYSGKGLGASLIGKATEFAKSLGCEGLFLQARPCEYDTYCKANGDLPIGEYLKLRRLDGQHIDKEIRFYEKSGLKIVKPVEDGEIDAASRNYTVTMQFLAK